MSMPGLTPRGSKKQKNKKKKEREREREEIRKEQI